MIRQLQRKWGDGPTAYRMPPEAYLLYQAELQTLMDALALSGEAGVFLPEGETAMQMADFLGASLRRGDPLTVVEIAPRLHGIRDRTVAIRIQEFLLQALLGLGWGEEARRVLDGLPSVQGAADEVRLHWHAARTALLERRTDVMDREFAASLSLAHRVIEDSGLLVRVYDSQIMALAELGMEGLADAGDIDDGVRRWAGDAEAPPAGAEFLLARAAAGVRKGGVERVREDLARLQTFALPPSLEARKFLVEALVLEREGRAPEGREAFRAAFHRSLESGDAWVERHVIREGLNLARAGAEPGPFRRLLLQLTEEKDWYPDPDHGLRVGDLALRMAAVLRSLREDAEPAFSGDVLKKAAEFHDIGKWMLPWCILNRTLSFNTRERRALQLHPVHGEAILAAWGEEDAARVVAEHHTRWNGAGYPEGRSPSGSEASLLALAEAYGGASSATRKYPAPKDVASLLSDFKALRNIQFEGWAVDALLLVAARIP